MHHPSDRKAEKVMLSRKRSGGRGAHAKKREPRVIKVFNLTGKRRTDNFQQGIIGCLWME